MSAPTLDVTFKAGVVTVKTDDGYDLTRYVKHVTYESDYTGFHRCIVTLETPMSDEET